MADIIPLDLSSNQSGGDSSFHDSLSYTPPPNTFVLLVDYVVQFDLTPPPNVPVVSGNGLTWVQLFSQLFDHGGTDRARVSVFRGLGGSPTTGVTRTQYAKTQLRFAKTIFQFSNVDVGNLGANAVVQSKTAKIAADVTPDPSITLDSPADDPANSVVGICGYGDTDTAQNPSVVAGVGFGLLRNNPTTETGGQAMMFKQQVQQLCDWNMTLDTFDWAPMALELRNAIPFVEPVVPTGVGGSAFIAGNLIT